MSWDEYVKSCKEAVSQRQQQPDAAGDPRALPVELLQTFRLPGPCFDSVSLFINSASHQPFNLGKNAASTDPHVASAETRASSGRMDTVTRSSRPYFPYPHYLVITMCEILHRTG